jgi:Fur family zinc uptake transcriptional regulator
MRETRQPQPFFPAAGHDHRACASELLAHAEESCRSRGLTLSPQRRRVLGALAASHAPIGAYDIIDRLAVDGPRPAPISVYRALSFLTEAGLAHRIERLNAYVACARTHRDTGALVFLICETCHQVGEVAASDVGIDLATLGAGVGLTPRSAAIEITGICSDCARAAGA